MIRAIQPAGEEEENKSDDICIPCIVGGIAGVVFIISVSLIVIGVLLRVAWKRKHTGQFNIQVLLYSYSLTVIFHYKSVKNENK